jgi:hypothetical protein
VIWHGLSWSISVLGFNFAVLPLLVEVFGWPVLLPQLVILTVTAVHSWFAHRAFSFRRNPPARPARASANLVVMPRVSVVVPAYNSVAFIDAAMQSILAQTFSDFVLVVSDHSSTDGIWEALQYCTADPRVRLSRLAPGGGAPTNFNAVTDLATGKFVKLVCGSDVLYPESLAMQVAAPTAHPSAVLAASARDVDDAPVALRVGSLHPPRVCPKR